MRGKSRTDENCKILFGVLISLLGFFTMRLITHLDELTVIVSTQKEEIALVKQSIENIRNRLNKKYGEKVR